MNGRAKAVFSSATGNSNTDDEKDGIMQRDEYVELLLCSNKKFCLRIRAKRGWFGKRDDDDDDVVAKPPVAAIVVVLQS